MKKHIPALFLFLALFVSSSLHSQSPQGIPYQAVMRNSDGSVMASSTVNITFMIHDGTADGTVVYQESHSLTSNAQGLVSCVVGNGVVSQGNFASINWGSGAKFLHVMMGSTDLGTQQMLSVPYALHSSSADNAVNATNAVSAQTAANGFSSVSVTGDTLYMANGSFIIVPGISAANFPPAVLGCTDNSACNYSSAATQNDNSCLYLNATCDDGNANTTNDVINGSCVCAGTQTSGSGSGSQLLPGNATCATQNISVTGCGGQTSLTYDGRTYDLVEIGGQCWFANNLATDQYRNGDLIPTGLDDATWSTTTNGAYAIYNNDPANDATYGKLYNWFTTVDSRGLCPTGWHVPTDCEWMYLEGSLGMSVTDQETNGLRGTTEGGALKATTNWASPNTGATNSSGFTAIPGGVRNGNGTYFYIGDAGFWWSSTEGDSDDAWLRELGYDYSSVGRGRGTKETGFSVRCVRDSELSPIQGCTDGAACNFMSNANQDDGSCLYQNATCDDGNANTTNDVINGSCVCAGTAVGNGTYVPGNGATDIDGNTYTSIIINGQEWMQQNLAVTKYRNGDPIATGLSNTTWQNITNDGAYAIYNNDAANNTLYGKLYNWYAVNESRGLCPTGWHVPSDTEWTTLETNLGGSSVAGGKMKSTTGWTSPNTGATNSSGFTAFPGGYREANGTYNTIGYAGYWWSSSENYSSYVWYRSLAYDVSNVYRTTSSKQVGFSVRCVRD